ncbi:type II secretion system protein [Methyloversatilis sp.]|uniref:type II secretion system protein n=1 Tax=Methyloversatilis sp. TaxID=2569862 RepID=UPI0035AE8EB4
MSRQRGFTLIEIAIALTVIALLGIGAIGALQMAMLRTRIAETRAALDEAREAVTAYTVANRSLPCPAVSADDGTEQSRAGGSCTSRRGLLPWSTLGVRGLDGWGNRIGYLASPSLVKSPAARIGLTDPGGIELFARDAAGNEQAIVTQTAVAFALWSHGENGRGATSAAGTLIADDSTNNVDEDMNSSQPGNGIRLFAREGSSNVDAVGGPFDDLVTWESRFVLFGRMINSGQLP